MGKYTQHGYIKVTKFEAWWNQPLVGKVSPEKAFVAMGWFVAGIATTLLVAAVYYPR